MKLKLFALLLMMVSIGFTFSQSKKQKNYQQGSYTSVDVFVDIRIITSLPPVLYESSGIIVKGANEIWSHEDSGNANKLYCFDTTGQLIRTLVITNATNVDWEDLALDNLGRVYIADAGNNNNNRTNLAIYRIADPGTITGNSVNAEVIRFAFEDQTQFPPPRGNRNFDIEAMIWHNDSLFLFTKNRSNPFNGFCKMYKLPAEPGDYTAQLIDSVFIGPAPVTGRIAAADINPLTGELVLLASTKIVSFINYPANRFFQGERTDYIFTTTPGQNEGLAFVTANRLYMTEEVTGSNSGYLYEIILPSTSSSDMVYDKPILKIFPNPGSDIVFIECNWPDSSRFEVFDVSGQLLYRKTLGESKVLPVSDYQSGIYIILIEKNGHRIFRRWIKK